MWEASDIYFSLFRAHSPGHKSFSEATFSGVGKLLLFLLGFLRLFTAL